MKKLAFTFLAVAGLLSSLWAGVTPKPEMNFSFIYQTAEPLTVMPQSSEQLQCADNQCTDPQPLGHYGIQKLYCQPDSCFSIAYEYEPYQKLIIAFSDGVTRQSQVFAKPAALRNSFNVLVQENDLLVELSPQPQPFNALLRADAWLSLIIILLMELLAAFAYLAYTGRSYRVLYSVIVANLITTALSWQVLGKAVQETALIWFFCLFFEAVFVWLCNRRKLSFSNALALSVATNVTSYSVGMIISFLLAPYLF